MLVRPAKKIIIICPLLLGVLACTGPGKPTARERPVRAGADHPPDYAAAALEASVTAVAEEEEAEEDLEIGFCRDDIYARHLKEKYGQLNPLSKRLKRHKARSSRRRARRQHAIDALHFANHRLNGKVAPYFGGIPVVVNERVEFWVNYFKKRGRRDFMRWLVRGESLKDVVFPVLAEQGIPQEFFYLAMVESGFNHGAYSRARATGTWQFMHGTARLYGLKINHWVDERRDPVRSTVAAATYLRDLYAQLGDWYLAMAAYNAGPGKVRRAIRRTRSRDFWKIAATRHLAIETRQYVPKVLAAILLSADPQIHGFEVKANPADALPKTTVNLSRPVYLSELARQLGIPRRTLKAWNPEIIRGITPPRSAARQGYDLRLPATLAARFPEIESRLTQLEVTDIHMHRIRQGDTLSHIARRYKVRVRQILSLNPTLRAKALRPGRKIAIPVPGVVTRKGAG